MSFAGNPFTSAPRLPSPVKNKRNSINRLSLHARTASRSPVRPRDVDSLLRDLSPTTTLRAFRAHPNPDSDSSSNPSDMGLESANADILARSIESSSESERALGAKAAQSCLDLRTWLREMENWTWPGCFDVPEHMRKDLQSRDGLSMGEDGEEYWGSLPARTVRAYEQRADEIGQLLDEMDVDELKEYVLSSHYRANSRPPSRSRRFSTMSSLDLVTSDMKRLDDFTALVTATILQALPFLSRLNSLLDVWTIRLIVLRSAPQYVRELQRARAELHRAWTAISVPMTDGDTLNDATVDRQTVFQLKSSFEHQVGSLGRKLDRFLDDLEGREDSVPDSWIDDFEDLESTFGAWVAQADRRVLESEWRQSRGSRVFPTIVRDGKHVAELEAPPSKTDAVRRLSIDTSLSGDPFESFDQAAGVNQRSSSPSIDAVPSPALHQDILTSQPSDSRSISERLDLNVGQSANHRSVSDSAAQEKCGGGSIAKRRAAFLNDIERTNSLKLASKSPVRSFEHASNAFTKLFKKDRSPEKARPVPKRSGSGRSALNGQLNTVLAASIRSQSPNSSAQPSKEQAWSGVVTEASESPTINTRIESPEQSAIGGSPLAQNPAAEPVYEAQAATSSEHSGPETFKPSRLSAPFESPTKTHPEDWPLSEASSLISDRDQQQQQQQQQTVDGLSSSFADSTALPESGSESLQSVGVIADQYFENGNQGHDFETSLPGKTDTHNVTGSPTSPLQTDAFDRIFVESLPQPPTETPGSINAPERSAPWTGSRRRHSLPRPQRGNIPGLLRRSSVSSSYLENEYVYAPPAMPYEGSPGDPSVNVKGGRPEELDRKWVHRASATFIEAFPRSELKSINVSRPSPSSSSCRSTSGSQASPPRSLPESTLPVQPVAPFGTIEAPNKDSSLNEDVEDVDVTASSPARLLERIGTDGDAQNTPHLQADTRLYESSPAPSGEPESPLQSAPLNAAMIKRRGNRTLNGGNKTPMYTLSPASPSNKSTQSRQGEDTFDRHVSEVVSTLPAPIKFRSRPGAETPVHHSRTESRASLGPRPKNPPSSRAPSRAGMMIAPAESSPKKYSAALDSEVKLYHLTQAGRDEPIKLFVRLVGEGERVMVRVGGGWADLADYLRQYAEHHGSRTVSDGGLEMQTAPSGHSRRISGPVELKARPSPATPVLESGRTTPFRPQSRESDTDWSRQRPGSSGIRDVTNVSPFAARAPTPTLYGTNTRSSTPKSSSGSSNSRPSTANGAGSSRPSSRQSTPADSHGLAGPSSNGKRGMLPDHKAKWVDSMIERARASAEKSKESAAKEKYFGELGKAGGTRRLVFRSGSGSGAVEKK